jgi:DNA-binding NarL/FixJ family response regulator
MSNSKIRVLLVDDQLLFVHSLAQVIMSRADDIVITSIQHNGEDAIRAAQEDQPDVLIMDIKMPGMGGVEASRAILKQFPHMKIMMLTTFDEDEYVFQALGYGVKGYLLKTILPEEVITAIRAIYAGINQISPSVVSKLTENLRLPDAKRCSENTRTTSLPTWFIELTRLEKEILELVVQGFSNKEIATTANLAEQTVKNYLTNIYGKMGVHKRSQVVKLYLQDRIDAFK